MNTILISFLQWWVKEYSHIRFEKEKAFLSVGRRRGYFSKCIFKNGNLKWPPFSCLSYCILTLGAESASILTCASSVTQSCPTLCDPMDCSPPGPWWVSISSSREPSWFRIEPTSLGYPALASGFFTTVSPGSIAFSIPVAVSGEAGWEIWGHSSEPLVSL